MDFQHIKHAVATQFAAMSKHQLFCTGVEKDDLWTAYLAAFPAGTNPVFRERTEHDCSCCRHFIRAVGNVVAVIDGKVVSIWDGPVANPSYQIVSDAMAKLVKSKAISDEFLHPERTAGTDKTFEDILDKAHTWSHFHVRIPEANYCRGADIATKLSVTRTDHDVFARALKELSVAAINTVLELIGQNSLYRGDEHKFAVQGFLKAKVAYDKLKAADRDAYVWQSCMKLAGSITRIRSTSIGTLLIDLSAGVLDMDDAVRKFEAMVAPMNYKRPTALVTPSMVKKAKETIEELGLTSALERRYATLADVSVNNVIFADRSALKVIGNDVFDSIPTKATNKRMAKVEEVSIEQFIANIVPNAELIEVMFENRHQINLTSLVAPVDPTAKQLFKWDNNFSWSYNGDVAGLYRERVKQAGGNVSGDLCCRLAWFNYDDLDFHMREPDGNEIDFRNRGPSRGGGRLYVDMNAGGAKSREPVENIFYGSRSTMKEGVYELFVHNFNRRETSDVGFEVEIDWLGQVTRFVHEKALGNKSKVTIAKFRYSKADGIEMIQSLPSSQGLGRNAWNLQTQDFHKVNLLMLSPNFWDGRGVGNKHYFFMLSGCQNDGAARGFFNEFLRDDLKDHRKVIELVGAKMKTDTSDNQISGLGFSSTQRNEILARVKGNFTRTVKVTF